MFSKLMFSGIKGMSRCIKLDRVNAIHGPNESGKSAAANALQLAVTGKCDIGAQVGMQQKLLEGSFGEAIATGHGIAGRWSIKAGKKAWEDPGTQGNLPVTVDEFWELTGAQRLSLLVPTGAIASIEERIATAQSDQKRLKALLDAPAPIEPDEYTGEPVGALQEKLREIEAKLHKHQEAKKNKDLVDSVSSLTEKLDSKRKELLELTGQLVSGREKASEISRQLAIYGESTAGEPRIIKSARERGVTIRKAVSDTLSLVAEVCKWTKIPDGSWPLLIEDLQQLIPDELVGEHSSAIYEGVPVAQAARLANEAVDKLVVSVSVAEREIESLDVQLQSAKKSVDFSGLLSMEEAMELTAKKGEISEQIVKANAWKFYEQQLQKNAATKDAVSKDLEDVNERLMTLKSEMESKVNGLKASIESAANSYLREIGKPELSISIAPTGRGWSMDVSIGDVALEAMAKSRRLLYGLCLLSAIHEASEAACPVLIAECAEMDPQALDGCIKAMKLRTKGNVLLEHWHKPSVDINLISAGE